MDEPADDIKSIASEMEEDQKLPEPIPAGLDEKGPNQDAHADGGGVEDKKQAILHACRTRDLARLRALAESPGGFLSDDLRQQACKCLPSFDITSPSSPLRPAISVISSKFYLRLLG